MLNPVESFKIEYNRDPVVTSIVPINDRLYLTLSNRGIAKLMNVGSSPDPVWAAGRISAIEAVNARNDWVVAHTSGGVSRYTREAGNRAVPGTEQCNVVTISASQEDGLLYLGGQGLLMRMDYNPRSFRNLEKNIVTYPMQDDEMIRRISPLVNHRFVTIMGGRADLWSSEGRIKNLVMLEAGHCLLQLTMHWDKVTTVDSQGSLMMIDPQTGEMFRKYCADKNGPTNHVVDLGEMVATSGADNQIKLWDMRATDGLVRTIPMSAKVSALAFGCHKHVITAQLPISGSAPGTITFWRNQKTPAEA
ncbi:MAG: hypothetical protein A3F09_03510 [Chlamydiae bacterium RIFCSPHIGHO2_12_FULL_49_11]|nr:MAG: hypothetical protein A3F09_03510 [Chlamydiae bacterium RIFCSPHIGHO2_12_FULL_49_11]